MRFHVITLFPEALLETAKIGVVGNAIASDMVELSVTNPRSFTTDVHHKVDDRPFGGGDGMIMMPEPLEKALNKVFDDIATHGQVSEDKMRVIHLSPRGKPLTDAKAHELALLEDVVLISSRYGGLDQRFINRYVDEEISIGDFVLSGGEIAALAVIDAVGRLVPGVLGNELSANDESFSGEQGLLEYPQFTRPREWIGYAPPATLLSGDHKRIASFKFSLRLMVTAELRPELLSSRVKKEDVKVALRDLENLAEAEFNACGLKKRSVIRERLEKLLN